MIPLDSSAQAIFDADGKATVELMPVVYGYRWHVRKMYVTATSQTLKPECRIYQGYVSFSRQIGTTYNGNEDASEEDFVLKALDRIIAVWNNGDPGSIATFGVIGQVLAWNEHG